MARVSTIGPPPGSLPEASVQGTLALEFEAKPPPIEPLRMLPGRRAELDGFARRFAAAVVEVVGGDRGPQQLLRWTSEEVYEQLVRRGHALAGASGNDQRLRRLRAQVRSVHVYCPAPDAAEVSIHVRHGHRSRAIAARLELCNDRWTCVALQFG